MSKVIWLISTRVQYAFWSDSSRETFIKAKKISYLIVQKKIDYIKVS